MNLINPQNHPYADPRNINIGGSVFRPDFHIESLGYEELTVKDIHYKRVISNDFGDYFEDEVSSPDEANWFDIELDDGSYINPYETFLVKEEAQKYALKELESSLIPDTENFINTHKRRLENYTKLKNKIKEYINV